MPCWGNSRFKAPKKKQVQGEKEMKQNAKQVKIMSRCANLNFLIWDVQKKYMQLGWIRIYFEIKMYIENRMRMWDC